MQCKLDHAVILGETHLIKPSLPVHAMIHSQTLFWRPQCQVLLWLGHGIQGACIEGRWLAVFICTARTCCILLVEHPQILLCSQPIDSGPSFSPCKAPWLETLDCPINLTSGILYQALYQVKSWMGWPSTLNNATRHFVGDRHIYIYQTITLASRGS